MRTHHIVILITAAVVAVILTVFVIVRQVDSNNETERFNERRAACLADPANDPLDCLALD